MSGQRKVARLKEIRSTIVELLPELVQLGLPLRRVRQRVERRLAITTDFPVRILASANEKMGTDLGPDIEFLKAEYP